MRGKVRKMRPISRTGRGHGAVCIWHVARGGLGFWGKNEGDEGGQPAMEHDEPIVQNKANSGEGGCV